MDRVGCVEWRLHASARCGQQRLRGALELSVVLSPIGLSRCSGAVRGAERYRLPPACCGVVWGLR